MNDLISRSALMTDIESSVIFSGKPESASAEMRGANKIIGRIKAAPAVDAVEVVRCKNCDHLAFIIGEPACSYHIRNTGLDDFCSYGERITE